MVRVSTVMFRDVWSADPVAAVEELYSRMDRPFLGEHADAIHRYIQAKPKGKFGTHKYSPEEWGFDADSGAAEYGCKRHGGPCSAAFAVNGCPRGPVGEFSGG